MSSGSRVVEPDGPFAQAARGRIHKVKETRIQWLGGEHLEPTEWLWTGFACGGSAHRVRKFMNEVPEGAITCTDCFRPADAFSKKEARTLVTQAIANGFLVRQPCEICGNPKTDAHHDDYSKPLKVRWLCRRDHAAWHKAFEASFGSSEVAS